MSEPFLGEVKMVGFNFPPRGWAFCDGQIMSIAQNQSLYSILGTIYGGDGRTTFALPDLRGRTPIHVGDGGGSTFQEGQKGGAETITLTTAELPSHNHTFNVSSSIGDTGFDDNIANQYYAVSGDGATMYGAATSGDHLAGTALSSTGGSAEHNNIQPYLAINFCIALQGLFPSRN